MARTKKIDVEKLKQYIDEGKRDIEIAEIFGVSSSAITQCKQKLNLEIVRTTVIQAAPLVVERNLNTIDQLNNINEHANTILTKAMSEIDNPETNGKSREISLKAMAEIRNQLKLQLEIYQTLYDLQAVEEFQKEILTAIGEVEPDVRDRIIQRLKENRSIRAALERPNRQI